MKVYVIGNGYSINLVRILEEKNHLETGAVDFRNLFAKGDCIPGEGGAACYLSKINCPKLWELGVRCVIDTEKASQIISNIISSYTLYVQKCKIRGDYIDAKHQSVTTYFELNRYLKKLILYYDGLIVEAIKKIRKEELSELCFPLISDIGYGDLVISYNYDVLFERLLMLKNKKFKYVLSENDSIEEIRIYKPHGSINFDCINEENENLYDLRPEKINILHLENKRLEMDFNNSMIIPPSGFIVGKDNSWVANIRNGICYSLKSCCPTHISFFGLSYDIVDRNEINEILCYLDTQSTQVIYINPDPAPSLDFILAQNYNKYVQKKP